MAVEKNIHIKHKFRYIYVCPLLLISIGFLLSSGHPTARASVILILPDNLETKELNADRPRKLTNRYSDIGQINNQYRGELLYKPDNNGIVTYRDDRFYLAAYFSTKIFSPEEIEGPNEIISDVARDKYRLSYFGSFGYYFNRNMSVEFEYFDYTDLAKNIAPNIYNNVTEFTMDTKNYVFNFLVEINEAKLIPLFGGGLGVAKSDFRDYGRENNPTMESKILPMYQIVVGLEFDMAEQLLFGIRCKLYGTFRNRKINDDYTIKYGRQYFIGLGFKYIM
jgi:hypothetical protein